MDPAWFLQIGDEVLDVGRSDVGDQPVSETRDERLEAVVNRLGQREAFGDDVPLLVDLGELAERLRADFSRWIDASFVECIRADSRRSSSKAMSASVLVRISRFDHFSRLTRAWRKRAHHECSHRSRARPLCSHSL
jgi:hypothetical protein